MDLKEAINEIPNLVKVLKEKFMGVVEQKFIDAKLKDGTIVSYDGETPAVGMPLFVIDEKGERLPVPDGEHELEDGSVIVTNGGMIVEIKPSATEEPKAEEEMSEGNVAPVAQSTPPVDVKSIVESIIKETRFVNEEYEAKFLAIENENATLKTEIEKLSGLLKETFAVVEVIAAQPSVEVKPKNDGFMKKQVEITDRQKEITDFRAKYLNS